MKPIELETLAHRSVVLVRVLRWLVHDMRSPLQLLCLAPELHEGETDRQRLGSLGTAVADAAESLSGAVGLLDRLGRPLPPPYDPQPVALADSFRFLGDLASRSGLADRVDAAPALAARLPAATGTPEHLDLMLLTLLLNALGADGRQAGHVRLEADVTGGTIRVGVCDDGPPNDDAARPWSAPYASPGQLGLAVIRRLARAWGGDLRRIDVTVGNRLDLLLPGWPGGRPE